uniref:Uncharacterized protein n=1 Tax=Anguilla anguilla TaxID=7936 RepID=A0A0E9QZ82_ANGAN
MKCEHSHRRSTSALISEFQIIALAKVLEKYLSVSSLQSLLLCEPVWKGAVFQLK